MKCAYHPQTESDAPCPGCGKPLCGRCLREAGPAGHCPTCQALAAADEAGTRERDRIEEQAHRKTVRPRGKILRNVALWVILAACFGVIFMEMPKVIAGFEDEKPLRWGSYRTDAAADRCIGNLWRISRLLQASKTPGPELVCPVTGMAYRERVVDGETVYACPNPERHGVGLMGVSHDRPVPRVLP